MKLSPLRRRTAAWLWWMLPIVAVGGWFYPYLGYLLIPCMLAPFLIGLYRGRHWCGWLCPRGAFYDYVMPRFSGRRRTPAWLRSNPFRIGLLAFLMGMMAFQIARVWPDPKAIGLVFVLLLGVTTLAGIGLAVAFSQRSWCTVCPMGSTAFWVSKGKRPLTVSDDCRLCDACSKVCAMELVPNEPNGSHGDCLKCNRCVEICPVKALVFLGTDDHA
jgi:ferredoxin-type protein NapH